MRYPDVMANRWLPDLLVRAGLRPPPAPPRRTATTAFTVVAGGRAVEVRLRRNARAKRYTLRLDAKGAGAVVTLPRRGTIAEARAFVTRHADWLAERLAPETASAVPADGDMVPVRGVPHRLACTGAARGAVALAADGDGRPVLVVPGAPEHRRRRLETFLKRLARDDLAAAVARHAGTLCVRPTAIRLKDTTSRWGSASAAGGLSFSWRLVMAPPFVLDYLAAHEVAHLVEMNHSDRFWTICRRLAPRTEEAKAWLKAEGRGLHRLP
ncbi:M48 family metallopeptidase [Oharaeibacter diazotrophicus]|uniref:YgjP-like metallopeptidase domain-containing protein n=2 Tax=Oharaeibacter diazotrophicus TaxID=1920512 RepID=A0A4R6R7K9_9HYPH|nr:SprT family zinc-dependent metalloprotease [Oharaeibacter diazotrophicus]TDP81953.1 hypothetical protein EDD54_4214 [Oharaeibacter diazotrophicus]BBE73585.1 hypothetical protein OHA_1_03199 [Pleomorphomonas sp. SM30]GLS75375.1 metal-dependent hydrolase [Oharaeibacter diazotrophicus]